MTTFERDTEPSSCAHCARLTAALQIEQAATTSLRASIREMSAALQQAQTWRTMDSAPKDGTEILVSYDDDECVQVVTWDATCEGWLICENIYLTPTYWMPLPPPPAGDPH